MKKRNRLHFGRVLRFCISSLLAVALLVVYRSSTKDFDSFNVTQIRQNTAAADVRVLFHDSESKEVLAEWGKRVWVPVVLAPDCRPRDSVAAVSLIHIKNLPAGAKLPVYVLTSETHPYKPLPTLVYGLFLLAFGVTGFFSIAPKNRWAWVKRNFIRATEILKSK
jgi:hypothetical protein